MIAGGLFGVAAVLCTSRAWTTDMAAVLLGVVTFFLALAMGAAMAPATESVMSAVPDAKAGVGSAMSDVTRQVGGAWASPSSARSSAARTPATCPTGRPPSRSAPPRRGQRLGGVPGQELAEQASRAFTDALGIGLSAAAVVALAGRCSSCGASRRADVRRTAVGQHGPETLRADRQPRR